MHSSVHPGLIEKGGAMGTADHIAKRNKTSILWAAARMRSSAEHDSRLYLKPKNATK